MFGPGSTLVSAAETSSLPATGLTALGKQPICFEANHGQAEESATFIARGPAYYFTLSATRATVSLRRFGSPSAEKLPKSNRGPASNPIGFRCLQLEFLNANPMASVSGEGEFTGE